MLTPILLALVAASSPPPLRTQSEASGFIRTGRYDEVDTLCHAFAARYPQQATCFQFGLTPERRPMWALAASADGTFTPELAHQRKRTVVLAQGGIHAGEIDGKDAGFLLLRELLDGTQGKDVLQNVTFVFVPVFNIDGHERFGPNNRPNQRGPEEMGWRVNAQNLNLNRDYTKAETPEMQAMLRLLNAWDPILYMDLHVTDGSKFQHDVSVMLEPWRTGPEPLKSLGTRVEANVIRQLTSEGHLPLDFYPSLEDENDPSSGFSAGLAPPRFSQAYWAARNRFGVLVETHSWKPYPHRVKTTHDVVLAFLEEAAKDGASWRAAADQLDRADLKARGGDVVLRYTHTERTETIDFQGYAYTREPSDVSGKHWVRYDESKPQVWKVPFHPELKPAVTATAPKSGWFVPAGWAARVAPKLRLHGFRYDVLDSPRTVTADAFRASDVKFAPKSFEGQQTATFTGAWAKEKVTLQPGSLWVPANQAGRELLVHLLDPSGPDSLAAWGFFNAAFEQKEYLEDYVVEEFARALMARDPKVKAEFEAKLKSDPEFAKSPDARLRFFAVRHPAWDPQLNRYPVLRQ